jgi:phosphate-selective porin OprO/OprP
LPNAIESRNTKHSNDHGDTARARRCPARSAARTQPERTLAAALAAALLGLATLAGQAHAQPEPAAQPEATPAAQQVPPVAPVAQQAPPVAPVAQQVAPAVRVGPGGFALESADKAFVLRIRGYVHGDARFFLGGGAAGPPHTFLLRRARPIFEGTIAQHIGFRLMLDFGGGTASVQDAHVDVGPSPALALRAGKFKAPLGLERLASANNLLFVERAFPTALAPNRDIGLQVHGELWDGALTYAVGVFNGVADGGSADGDTDKGKDVVGRVFGFPLRSLGVAALHDLGAGLSASFGRAHGTLAAPGLASFRTSGQQAFFRYAAGDSLATTVITAGDRVRLSPQLTWFSGPVGLLGEYVQSSHDVALGATTARLTHHAWQAAAVVVLGGDASYEGVRPRQAAGQGGLGAFELAGRLHELRVDPDAFPTFASPANAARRARGVTVGAGWWASRNLRVIADFDRTTFAGGAAGGNRRPENAVLIRTQVSW